MTDNRIEREQRHDEFVTTDGRKLSDPTRHVTAADAENHAHTAALRKSDNDRRFAIELAVMQATQNNKVPVKIKMHHGGFATVGAQPAIIALVRRDAVGIVNDDGSLLEF